MHVLVVGSGGREHALAWRLAKDPGVTRVFGSPGNPGIAKVGQCIEPAEAIVADLTVIGPEAPLLDGMVDRLRAQGRAVVGPTAAAAQLEGSKSFAKQIMIEAGVPTARYVTVSTVEEARQALQQFGYPIVLKADGLAAGKGVVIAETQAQAEAAVPMLLDIPGARLVIEEFLQGEEVSFIVLSDGERVVPLAPTQDHKRIGDGDTGPNTGGMGAYCDDRILTPEQSGQVMDRVILPTISHMRKRGTPFTGFLYAGLMMTADGPKTLEFNARLGDPETQALMHRMEGNWAGTLMSAARGSLDSSELKWRSEPSVCVVLSAAGYPGKVETGDEITGIESAERLGATVFQAGTHRKDGVLRTSGGRVLGVTARGKDLVTAMRSAYTAVEQIRFTGMHYRRDIGQKGLKRWERR